MKNHNKKNGKLSISEMLKNIQEQANAMPDDESEDVTYVGEEASDRATIEGASPEQQDVAAAEDPKNETGKVRYRFRVNHAGKNAERSDAPMMPADPVAFAQEADAVIAEPMADKSPSERSVAEVTLAQMHGDRENAGFDGAIFEADTAETSAVSILMPDEDEYAPDPMPSEDEYGDTAIVDAASTAEFSGVSKTLEFDRVPSRSELLAQLRDLRRGLEEDDSDGSAAAEGEEASEQPEEALRENENADDADANDMQDTDASGYILHGAQAHMQDTGDITYVFDGKTDGDELDEEEELVPPEVDDTDVNLMIAFGMDDELAKTIGEDRREQVEREISSMERELSEPEDTPFEYTSASQNKGIFKSYRKKYGKVTIKIAICAVLLLISFLYENITAFGGTLADAINPKLYPVTHIMIDLQLVLLGGVLIWRRLRDGLRAILHLKPIPDSVISVMMLLTVAYDIGMCFMPYGSDIYLYGFPMLFGVMTALVFELFNLRREIFSFNIVASKRIKFTIGRTDEQKAALERETFAGYLDEEPSIFKLNKASFIDGFFEKMRPSENNRRFIGLLLALGIALTAAMVGLGGIWFGDFSVGVTVGYAALMMCMPLAVYLTYSVPFYRASQIAYGQDSAILGEEAIDEYAEASVVTFDDRDVFPSYGVKVRSIKVFGNNRIDNIIYHAASVFRLAGGPLSDVFDIATAELGHSEDVRLLAVEPDGIEAVVSGTSLHFGKDEYLRRHGFVPLTEDDDGQAGGASIMYMVSDGEVTAKMYIHYRIDPDFEATLKQLYRYGICVGIKTMDPNIDDEMLSHRIKLDRYPVRILKCREPEDSAKVLDHAGSSLVSKHSSKALLKAFTLCAKVQRLIRLDTVINVISMLIGIVIMLAALVLGGAGQIPSVYVALYQLFWAIPMYLIAKMMIQ